MKKALTLLIACVILVSAMTACTSHTHTEPNIWTADASSHWMLCTECGEKFQSGDHALDEYGHCGTCNSDITVSKDSVRVETCDEAGTILVAERFDNDGNPLSQTREECLYDDNGCLLEEQYYVNGQLVSEVEYTVVDGESIQVMYFRFIEDGKKLVSEYDVYGNETKVVCYDAEGNLEWQTSTEYAQTLDGEWYEAGYTQVNSDGTKNVVTFTEYGDTTSDITYDAEGNVLTDYANAYTYDENGIITSVKFYENGVIFSEFYYKVVIGEDGPYTYAETEISYNEDGSCCACVYSESGELLTMTSYDADGNVIE